MVRRLQHKQVSFSRWNMCYLEKQKKTLNIFDTVQPIFILFSTEWSHCVCPSNSSNRWTRKCRARSTFTKCVHFWSANISRKLLISRTVLYNKISKGIWIRQHRGQWPSSLFPQILLRFPSVPVENKNDYGSLRLLNIFEHVLQIMIWVLRDLQKVWEATGGCRTWYSFSMWKMGCIEKSEHIEYLWRYSTNFLHSLPCVWENNGLLDKIYWDDLDIIDQCHSKGNVSQFCLYLRRPWTNFNKISTTMMESWPVTQTKSVIILTLKMQVKVTI